MRFLLINPYYPISETPTPPLGVAFLAAALEERGVEVRILDFVVFPYSKTALESVMKEFKPDMLGATSVTMTFDNAIEVIGDAKSIDRHVLTVMGGAHVSFCARETMTAYPELDFIIVGEGEKAIVELSTAVEKGSGLDDIQGLVFRKGSELAFNKARTELVDVDAIPLPARHLLPLGRYKSLGMTISMTTSRGCPFKCIFCIGRKLVGSKVRYRDPQKVVDEFEYLCSLNFSQINLADDLFTANKKHCHGVCDEILKRGLKTKWTSFARVDTVSTDVLSKMKKAGCTAVSFGIESANADILKTIKKGITTDQVVEAVKMCKDAGVEPHASFILGLPGESPETLKETHEFAEEMRALGLLYGYHLLAPFPGTAVRDENEKYDLNILTDDWREYHANRAIVSTSSVTREMLDDVIISWEEKYNNDLEDVQERIQAGEASPEESEPFVNLERIVLVYDLMMGSVIEKKGSWPASGNLMNGKVIKGEAAKDGKPSDKELLETLVDRVNDSFDSSRETISNTLIHAVEQGGLRHTVRDGLIKWEWVDYL